MKIPKTTTDKPYIEFRFDKRGKMIAKQQEIIEIQDNLLNHYQDQDEMPITYWRKMYDKTKQLKAELAKLQETKEEQPLDQYGYPLTKASNSTAAYNLGTQRKQPDPGKAEESQFPPEISDEEIEKIADVLGKESTAPDKDTPDWMLSDIRRGMKAYRAELRKRIK